MKFAAVIALIAPSVVIAQEGMFTPTATEACLEANEQSEDCVGASAQICMEVSRGGYSTAGMTRCVQSETEYWNERLDFAYSALMTEYQGEVELADALRAMQTAWMDYRDAACHYARSQWDGGSGGVTAAAGCRLHLSAEHALTLEAGLRGLKQR